VYPASLPRRPDWASLDVRSNIGIVVAKMLIMPALALSLMLTMDRTIGHLGLNWVTIADPFDETFYLAAVAVAATPTANNMMVMTELAGGNGRAMSTAIFSQYLAAPVVLTGTLTIVVLMLKQYGSQRLADWGLGSSLQHWLASGRARFVCDRPVARMCNCSQRSR
jgi:predicted permease